jgi:hypothetical protein
LRPPASSTRPQLGSTRGRADDIGEQYGDQNTVRRRTPADAGEELLDLIENQVLVPDPGRMVDAGKLDDLPKVSAALGLALRRR